MCKLLRRMREVYEENEGILKDQEEQMKNLQQRDEIAEEDFAATETTMNDHNHDADNEEPPLDEHYMRFGVFLKAMYHMHKSFEEQLKMQEFEIARLQSEGGNS